MTSTRPFRRAAALGLAAALALPAAPASARGAADLRDLVDARAAGGEGELQARGYVMTGGHKSAGASFTYWWSPSAKACVAVKTTNGRFASIRDTGRHDCNQSTGGSDLTKEEAIGAAIGVILGVAALAHKSGHHADQSHYAAQADEAEYERGYRDGLHGQPYHNYGRTEAYNLGFEAGVDQIGHERSYRNGHRNGGGHRASVNVADLTGARAAGAQSDLESRGFSAVDAMPSGNDGKITIWWNRGTRQCLQMITVEGRVDSLLDIGSHPRCR
jgi:hypothetical protein